MPALLPVEGVARVAVTGTYGTTNWANIFHVYKSGAGNNWSQDDVNDIATGLRAAFVTHLLPNQSADLVLTVVTATDLSDDQGKVGTASGTSPGGSVGVDLPANCAAVISWKISRHYRGGHPRTYLAGISLGNTLNERSFQPTFVSNVTADAIAFKNAVNAIALDDASQAQLCVVHRTRNGVTLNPPDIDGIDTATVDARIDSQRRRLGPDVN